MLGCVIYQRTTCCNETGLAYYLTGYYCILWLKDITILIINLYDYCKLCMKWIETEIGGSLLSACRLFYLSYCYVTLHGHGEWWCITLLLIIFIISLIMIQIAASIQKSSLQGTLSPILVQMLVDMHLFCASRHPLQRSIARYATWVMVVTIIRDI